MPKKPSGGTVPRAAALRPTAGSHGRVLLLESLDGVGASQSDANLHTATLEHAGFATAVLLLERRAGFRPAEEPDEAAYARVARAVEPETLGEEIATFRPDLVLIASSAPGGGEAADWIPAGTRALWWPTGLDGGPGRARGALPGIALGLQGRARATIDADGDPFAGIDGSVIESAADRRVRHGLWDGDYVLAPVPCAQAALEAFGEIASDFDSLDLVLLAHPEPELGRLASELGIGTRVHFAGPAPRRAEYAWYRSAAAALVSDVGSLSGGLVLRLLASGCPIVPVGEGGSSRRLGEWMVARGCAGSSTPESAGRTLARALDRAPAIERAIERGRAIALAHELETIAPRLAAVIRPELGRSQAAA